MEIQGITKQWLSHNNPKLDHGSEKHNDLKGIKPLAHDKDSNGKLDRQVGSDIYDVDCQSIVKTIEGMKPSQLTSGAGAG